MTKWLPIGFLEALRKTIETIAHLGTEMVSLSESTGRFAATDLISKVDSPSINASLKDGYAVKSEDVISASELNPIRLTLAGSSAAGDMNSCSLNSGEAFRILTGAKLPDGADAVLAEEFVEVENKSSHHVSVTSSLNKCSIDNNPNLIKTTIVAKNVAEIGRNILPKGSDVKAGECIVKKNQLLTPGFAGLLAAAGFSEIPVFKQPRVAIIATGDEVVAPGQPLPDGKLYASNMVTLSAFCHGYGMKTMTITAKDSENEIKNSLNCAMESADAVITSGGAWTGDRDMVAKILLDMGWKQIFHRIRIGPGKAVGFGMLKEKPIFILPGGPPSNLMGFLQIALPGLMRLAGHPFPGLQTKMVRLASDLHGRDIDWTQFVFGVVEYNAMTNVLLQTNSNSQKYKPDNINNYVSQLPVFHSLRQKGRLQSMAEATAIAIIPEGETFIAAGTAIQVQIISSLNSGCGRINDNL
ncbi:MAG: molybdopterin molybdotransferase MoeA [Desulfamplus sp.]|nr:molybdopterin molybdotransferase MoeA [Desulfamplus sp.]